MKSFIQSGKVIDYTAGADIASGDVVPLAGHIGIAGDAIANGAVGPVWVEGVFELAKATGALAVDDQLYWDNSAKNLTKTAHLNTYAGICVQAQLSGDLLARVKLQEVPAPIAAFVAQVATAAATDLTTSEALANQLKTSVNAILTALIDANLMKSS